MFFGGEALLDRLYRNYPPGLPLLVYHGTEDKVRLHLKLGLPKWQS